MEGGCVKEVKTMEWAGELGAGEGEERSWMDWSKQTGRVCHIRCGVCEIPQGRRPGLRLYPLQKEECLPNAKGLLCPLKTEGSLPTQGICCRGVADPCCLPAPGGGAL